MDLLGELIDRQRTARVLGVVGLLYLTACCLPCIDCKAEDYHGGEGPWLPDRFPVAGQHSGLKALLLGSSEAAIPWSANVFLVAGVCCLYTKRFRWATVLGGGAFALGLTTWWVLRTDTLLPGYYCWQSSLLALAAGSAWVAHRSDAEPVLHDPGVEPD
jgi:hypothetical protein